MLRHGPLVAAMRAPLPCLPRILALVPVFRPKFAVGNKTGSNCNQPALLRLARGMAGLDYSARVGVCVRVCWRYQYASGTDVRARTITGMWMWWLLLLLLTPPGQAAVVWQ